MNFFLTMTKVITSQNIGLSSRITLYIQSTVLTVKQRKLSKCLTTFRPAFRSVCNIFEAPSLLRSHVYPGGKGPGNSESLVYLRGCKITNDIKVLKPPCYLWMSYSRTEFSKLYLSGHLHCFIDVKKMMMWRILPEAKNYVFLGGYSRFVWRCSWSMIFSRVLQQPENKVTQIFLSISFLLSVLNDTRSGIRLISSCDDCKTEFSHILTKSRAK